MIDYSDLIQPDKGQDAHAIHLVDKQRYDAWLQGRRARERLLEELLHELHIASKGASRARRCSAG